MTETDLQSALRKLDPGAPPYHPGPFRVQVDGDNILIFDSDDNFYAAMHRHTYLLLQADFKLPALPSARPLFS